MGTIPGLSSVNIGGLGPDTGERSSRIDLRVGANNRVYLIEANPNPWLDPIAEFAMAAKESGLSYTEMIDRIVKAALARKK